MSWSEAQRDGFALGATVADDRAAALAAPGVATAAVDAVAATARQLAVMDRDARRAWVARAVARLRGAVPDDPLNTDRIPPRALALLAPQAPRPLAARWLASAPPPRAGYTPEPALRALLTRLITNAGRATASRAEPT